LKLIKIGKKKIDDMAQCWPHQIPTAGTAVAQFLRSHSLGTCSLPFPPISPNAFVEKICTTKFELKKLS